MSFLKLKKIKKDRIRITVNAGDGKVVFSYKFEKHEEELLNIAAGKIQRKICRLDWKVEGSVLMLDIKIKKTESYGVHFGLIASSFEDMVK